MRLATAAGVTAETVGRLERSTRRARMPIIEALAAALGVSCEHLTAADEDHLPQRVA